MKLINHTIIQELMTRIHANCLLPLCQNKSLCTWASSQMFARGGGKVSQVVQIITNLSRKETRITNDAVTYIYKWNENILIYDSIILAHKTR